MKYAEMLQAVVSLNERATQRVRSQINQKLVIRNWLIGAHIVEFEQNGADRAAYGTKLLSRMAADLKARGIPGCSREMLYRMRQVFLAYPQLGEVVAPNDRLDSAKNDGFQDMWPKLSASLTISADGSIQAIQPQKILCLSWSRLMTLGAIDDPAKRAFYENACLLEGWSHAELLRQIGSLFFERTGLSTDKEGLIRRAREQVDAASEKHSENLEDLIRDPYVLEFTGLPEQHQYLEADLEKALLDHLQEFLLELGTGFCFEARQRRVTLNNEHDYIDLVFYHRVLRCHLLIDLKVRPFKHGDAGQMNFYLNWWKDNVTVEGDNAPVGLILCSDKNQAKVEYATAGLDHQLFVSRYLVTLPRPEALQRLLEEDRAHLEQQWASLP